MNIKDYILVLCGGISEQRWNSMKSSEKREYIKEHPNSKYAREVEQQKKDKLVQKYKDRIKELKEMRKKYKRKSNLDLIDDAIKVLRAKIKKVGTSNTKKVNTPRVEQKQSESINSKKAMLEKLQNEIKKGGSLYNNKEATYMIKKLKEDIKKESSDVNKQHYNKQTSKQENINIVKPITPSKMKDLIALQTKLTQEVLKHNPGSKAQLEVQRKLEEVKNKLKSPLKADKSQYKNHSKEEIEAYEDDIKTYNEYVKRRDTDVQKDYDNLVDKSREASENYREAINLWLRSKRRAPYSDETKQLGAKVGELKKKANDAAYELDKYKNQHKNELNTGLLPPIPKLGEHKGRKLPRELTEEERNHVKTPTRIIRRYRR